MDEKGFKTIADVTAKACIAFRSSRISISRIAPSRASMRTNASSAISATWPAMTRRISASIWSRRKASWLSRWLTMCDRTASLKQLRRARSRGSRGRLRRLPAYATTCVRWTIALQWSSCLQDVRRSPGASLSQKKTEVTEDWEAMKAYREQVGIHIH
jgi:hypothetical protein